MAKKTRTLDVDSDNSDGMSPIDEKKVAEFDDDNDFDDSDDEVATRVFAQSKTAIDRFKNEEDDEEEAFDDEEEDEDEQEVGALSGDEDEPQDIEDIQSKQLKKLKKFTPEQLEKQKKRIKRTGVCYLSKIPPYMKPSKLRAVMTRFGEVDRLFLKPEDSTAHHKRVKYGGNKKKNFTEGWVEFVNKKDAKLAASTLNANKLGGFKWLDLTQQIARENEVRQAKLALELSQQQKLNKTFINNVEKSKMISNIQKKRKEKDQSNEDDNQIRRSFKQRKVTSTRADAPDSLKEKSKPSDKLVNVLSKVF